MSTSRLERHLIGCAAAALGGIAALSAAAPTADADIAYVTFSPALDAGVGDVIGFAFDSTPSYTIFAYGPGSPLDGTAYSFGLSKLTYSGPGATSYAAFLYLNTASPYPLYVVGTASGYFADQLAYGDVIDGSAAWYAASPATTTFLPYLFNLNTGPGTPPWSTGDSGYIGLKMAKGGGAYYGWLGVYVDSTGAGKVTGFGWETDIETSIGAGEITEAPEPGGLSLAALAMGAAGLARWRRARVD